MPTYSPDEIFDMARQIERDGARFYSEAAGLAPDEPTRKLLESLAGWEVRHERTFARMKDDLPAKEMIEQRFDPDGEAEKYMAAMVEGRVFQIHDPSATSLTGDESRDEILDRAIELEQRSILFYLGMRDLVPNGRDEVEKILREEMRHVRVLSEQKGR